MEIRKKLTWYLLSRVVIVSVFLGGTIVYYMRTVPVPTDVPTFWYLTELIVLSYLASIAAAPFLFKNYKLFIVAHFELFFDVLFSAALVLITGYNDSPFSFLYLMIPLASSLFLGKRSALLIGAFSFVGYLTILLFQHYKYMPPPFTVLSFKPITLNELVYSSTIYGIAILIVVLLSNQLTEQLRKTGEELSQKSEEVKRLSMLHESIVNSIPSGIIIVDNWDKVLFANNSLEQHLEKPLSQIIGRSFNELFDDSLSPEEMLNSFFPLSNIKYKAGDGRDKIFRVIASPFLSPGGTSQHKILVINDITKLQQLEGQLLRSERLAEIGKMAAGLAHEIRNPLASISGALEMVERHTTSNEANRFIHMAENEIGRLDKLIKTLLDYARPPELKIENLDVTPLIKSIIGEFMLSLSERDNVKIVQDLPSDPLYVKADRESLKQAILNLLRNALEAVNREEGEIKVRLGQKNGSMLLQVSDNGKGIAEGDFHNIFVPFYTTKATGYGLGLAITHRLIEEQNGKIEFTSKTGEGSVFTITLPLATPR